MSRITTQDCRTVLSCVHELFEAKSCEDLVDRVVRVMPILVSADGIACTDVDLPRGRVVPRINPASPEAMRLAPRFEAYLSEHPVIQHFQLTGDDRGRAISDFISRQQYHKSGLYNEFYRLVGVEDQLSIGIANARGHTVGVSYNRGRWGFSQRDHAVLDMIRTHLVQAYRNVELLENLAGQVRTADQAFEDLDLSLIWVNKAGRVDRMTGSAHRIVEQFFPIDRRNNGPLPSDLIAWAQAASRPGDALVGEPQRTIVIGHERLLLRAHPGADGATILRIMVQANTSNLAPLAAIGLTARETDVMRWLKEGKTNLQIGMILKISSRTAQKHLESIFRKLQVETRTAAVSRMTDLIRASGQQSIG